MQDKLQNRIQKIESSYKKIIENRVIIQKKKSKIVSSYRISEDITSESLGVQY